MEQEECQRLTEHSRREIGKTAHHILNFWRNGVVLSHSSETRTGVVGTMAGGTAGWNAKRAAVVDGRPFGPQLKNRLILR
jgi:hypothetical protein